MTKKHQLIERLKNFEDKFFNQDQKNIAIDILKNAPEEQVQAYADFIFMKRKTGFAFDYSPEIARGRLITLREDKKRRINVNDELKEDENKLIIGDNYNALKSLLVTHTKGINIIYIDPPYNTESAKKDGNNSSKSGHASKFVYKDKFGRGGWLNMMKSRLTLAKELLTDDGIIFVSIDDSEQAYLKVLMDDIFGESNFVNQLVWISNKKGRQISNAAFAKTYEYILMYSKKCIESFENSKIDRLYAEENMPAIYTPKKYNKNKDSIGRFMFQNELHNTNIRDFNINTRKNLFFPIYTNGINVSIQNEDNYEKILPPRNSNGIQGVWRWSKQKIEKENINLHVVKNDKKFKIYTKIRDSVYTPKDLLLSSKLTTKSGGNELNSLGIDGFKFPKPSALIKFLLKLVSDKSSIILDFFAGSGTTGQSVMDLNREDDGNRKFILCTNNENDIAHRVTYERLHRVIKGLTFKDSKSNFDWLKNNEPYFGEKLRVINLDDGIKISLDEDVSEKIYHDAQNGLRLLNHKYNKNGLNLYYKLAALNPLDRNEDKF